MSEKAPEKPPEVSEEYARFKELTRKLVAVPKKELGAKRKKSLGSGRDNQREGA
jgi:hypothetical protein